MGRGLKYKILILELYIFQKFIQNKIIFKISPSRGLLDNFENFMYIGLKACTRVRGADL